MQPETATAPKRTLPAALHESYRQDFERMTAAVRTHWEKGEYEYAASMADDLQAFLDNVADMMSGWE